MMPIPRRHGALTPVSLVALLASGAVLGACSSSFFRVTPENAAPVPAPVPAAAAKPVEQPVVAPPPLPEPPATASDSAGVARLMRIAMIWHIVRTHHPVAATDPEGWDAALVRHIPALRSASAAELPGVVARWLETLGDPATRVMTDSESPTPSADRGALHTRALGDSVVLLRYSGGAHSPQVDSAVRALVAASRVLIDARGARDNDYQIDRILPALARGNVMLPAVRARLAGADEWRVVGGDLLAHGARAVPPRIAVVADARTVLAEALAALVASGRATLVAEEGFDVRVAHVYGPRLPEQVVLPLEGSATVRVRTSEHVRWDGSPLRADTIVPRGSGADTVPAIRVALAALRSGRMPRSTPLPPRELPRFTSDQPDAPWPAMGARLLAAFRIWGAMRDEHAHRDGYDDDIDATLERTIPAVERASNAVQYAAALVDQVASFDDAAVRLEGASREIVRGVGAAPFRARLIEGRAVVTAVGPGAPDGVTVGTEITAVDGFPTTAWFTERRRTVSASSPWTRARNMLRDLPRGPEGEAMLRVRNATGPERQITMRRTAANVPLLDIPERTGDAVRRIGDVAYLDAERLAEQGTRIAGALDGSSAVIVDLRTSRAVPSDVLLGRLATRSQVSEQRVIRAGTAPCALPAREMSMRCSDQRRIERGPAGTGPVSSYRGRVVVLIDERTQGDAERLALALESSAGATLIGSASAGAAAPALPIELPGKLTLFMPREEIRRGDGAQLHRVGLTPAIEVRPTVRGIRAGTDEPLDRALAWLAPAESRRRR